MAKVADFGAAIKRKTEQEANYDPEQTISHTVQQFTPKYMAPEVKKKRKMSKRSDVWSFGKIMEQFIEACPDKFVSPKILSLMEDCMEDDFSARPQFSEIVERLKKVPTISQ